MKAFIKHREEWGRHLFPRFVILLIFISVTFPSTAHGGFIETYTVFEQNGITYCVTSSSDKTVDIVNPYYYSYSDIDYREPDKPAPYSGDINIKSEVISDNIVYRVTGIRKGAFYCSKIKSLRLPNTITEIGEKAFYKCEELEKSDLKDISIKKLPAEVFRGCSSLTSINIPSSVKEIGEYAFYGCKSLEDIIIPPSLTEIKDHVFEGCCLIYFKNIPETITKIGSYAFAKCWGMSSITIPSSVKEIGEYAFSSCSSLNYISLPSSINKISYGLLENCDQLRSVEIPVSVEEIESFAFSDCEQLYKIKIPESVKSIGRKVFAGCDDLRNINLPSVLTEISWECFSGCTSLEEIVLPSGIKRIGTEAFKGCRLLKNIEFPEALTEIGQCAFDGATSLSHIYIPKGVTTVEQQAFGNCIFLKNITVDDDNKIYSSYNGALYSKNYSTLIQYPAGKDSMEFHKEIKNIGYAACIGCSLLRSVEIPETINYIGYFAFSGCDGMTTLTLPSTVKELGCDAFAGCERLENIFCKALTPPKFAEASLGLFDYISAPYKGTFTTSTKNNANLYVPEESLSLYKEAYGWSNFNNINSMNFSGVTSVEATNLNIYVSGGVIHIVGIDDSLPIEIYSISGNKVYSGLERTVANLPSGIYIVRIGTQNRKVIV